jgi:hypothetical protein
MLTFWRLVLPSCQAGSEYSVTASYSREQNFLPIISKQNAFLVKPSLYCLCVSVCLYNSVFWSNWMCFLELCINLMPLETSSIMPFSLSQWPIIATWWTHGLVR